MYTATVLRLLGHFYQGLGAWRDCSYRLLSIHQDTLTMFLGFVSYDCFGVFLNFFVLFCSFRATLLRRILRCRYRFPVGWKAPLPRSFCGFCLEIRYSRGVSSGCKKNISLLFSYKSHAFMFLSIRLSRRTVKVAVNRGSYLYPELVVLTLLIIYVNCSKDRD